MKCKGKFINIFTVLLIGLVALNLSFTAMDNAVTHKELEKNVFNCIPQSELSMPSDMFRVELSETRQMSEPLAYLFQIIFILFFISPPLIVLMLFLIWKELKERNRLK